MSWFQKRCGHTFMGKQQLLKNLLLIRPGSLSGTWAQGTSHWIWTLYQRFPLKNINRKLSSCEATACHELSLSSQPNWKLCIAPFIVHRILSAYLLQMVSDQKEIYYILKGRNCYGKLHLWTLNHEKRFCINYAYLGICFQLFIKENFSHIPK